MIEYNAFNKEVFDKIPLDALAILDVGCGTGIMGKALKEQVKNRLVCGVTYSNEEYKTAKKSLDEVWVTDINYELPKTDRIFDCIIFSHVLEHTFYPNQVIKSFAQLLSQNGIIVIALPNILYYKQRKQFLEGKFQYSEEGGLMDITHFRFFDWSSSQKLIRDSGLYIISEEATGNFPLPFFRRFFPNISKKIDNFLIRKWPGLFGFQFVFVSKRLMYDR